MTPQNQDLSSGKMVVHSKVPNDVQFPLLPVPWTGEDAIDESKVQELITSSELRRSQMQEAEKRVKRDDAQLLDINVREMSFEDLKEVLVIEKECFNDPYEENYFRAVLRKGNYFIWVAEVQMMVESNAEEEGEKKGFFSSLFFRTSKESKSKKKILAGYVSLRIRESFTEICSIAVRKSCRGLGIAKLFMERALNLAKIYRSEDLKLHVSVFNSGAMELYKKYGIL